ncbi:MAG: hypothetical protein WC496_02455 [Phycisphaerae bacterium]|jgi:hypothetical protein
MKKEMKHSDFVNLPACVADYIKLVIKKMRWHKKVRADVQAELISHFEDALKDCKTNEDKEKTAKELIANFGDAKLIATLTRRAKKRCRPLWQKVLIHSFQIIGIIIIYIVICGVYLSSGKPNISLNYVEWLNNYVRQGRDESLNSAPMIKKTADLFIDEPNWLKESKAKWPDDFNEIQLKEFENWLLQNSQAIETFRKASEKPYYWNIYDANKSDFTRMNEVLDYPMKELSKYRWMARIMDWQVRYSAYRNETQTAVNDVIDLCKFGHNMQGTGLLVEQLVGIAIEAVGFATTYDVISKNDVSVRQLEDLQSFFQQERGGDVINIEAEKVILYDFIQRNFADDGKGGGRPVRQGTGFAGKNTVQIIFNILIFNLPDRKKVIEQVDNVYDAYRQLFESSNFESAEIKFNQEVSDAPMLLQISFPALKNLGKLSWRFKTQRDGLITTLAVMRYKKQTGKYPDG